MSKRSNDIVKQLNPIKASAINTASRANIKIRLMKFNERTKKPTKILKKNFQKTFSRLFFKYDSKKLKSDLIF